MEKGQVRQQTIPYPKSVFFIISNEFCERFSYYGMKAVLILFLSRILKFTENESTQIYHTFSGLCYFTPLFGAMLADSKLGKYRTILYLSIVYVFGNIVLSVAALPSIGDSALILTMIGLLLIGVGTGGIKPCVAAFGGDQFKLPEQALQLATFFSVFYFSINAGSLISTFLTPKFREFQCFDHDCYLLAFSVPAGLMVVALIIFMIGKSSYQIKTPQGNVVIQVTKCITHAIMRKGKSSDTKEHWLDHAEDKYSRELIRDVKVILKLFVLYLPLPFFWALFDQQGSRWTFQATRMTGELWSDVQILPDQMQIVNPLLILLLIPIFDQGIYPCLGKLGLLKKPLQRLTLGGVLAAIAFVVSGILEIRIQDQYPAGLQSNESMLNFVNHVPCQMRWELTHTTSNHSYTDEISVFDFEMGSSGRITPGEYNLQFRVIGKGRTQFDCSKIQNVSKLFTVTAMPGNITSHVLTFDESNKLHFASSAVPDRHVKTGKGDSFVKFFYTGLDKSITGISLNGSHSTYVKLDQPGTGQTEFVGMKPYLYIVRAMPSGEVLGEFYPRLEGVYVLALSSNGSSDSKPQLGEYAIVEPNTIHMLWLLPQYIIITVAEVMFSVTGLEFSYSQAPETMKSVIQAAWLLTVAFGNIIVLIIAGAHIFDEQAKEFFLFAGLMVLDMLIFAFLAMRYKPNGKEEEKEKKSELELGHMPASPETYLSKPVDDRSA